MFFDTFDHIYLFLGRILALLKKKWIIMRKIIMKWF